MSRSLALRLGLLLTFVGTLGMVVGHLLYPTSNLLGGFGLLFGPIQGIGVIVLFFTGMAHAVTLALKRRGREADPRAVAPAEPRSINGE